jgi:putative hydrolase of the HAD superfamily
LSLAERADAPIAAVFLDAGGTLLAEHRPRAAIYAEIARAHGLDVSEPSMRELMYRTHAELPRSVGAHFRYSEGWFAAFIARIYQEGLRLPPSELSAVQGELFARFADPASFRAFPGARELLATLRARGLAVGVVSNWSERLPEVLDGLGLSAGLDFVLVSALERCEKPEPEIFRRALARAGVDAARAVHAGDDVTRDVHGARGVGILPVLVDRSGSADVDAARVRDLFELERWILERLR